MLRYVIVVALLLLPKALAQDSELLDQINAVRKIYEKIPLALDPKLMRLAKKEITDKNFCVSNTSLRLVKEKVAKEVAWACGIKSPKEVFQYWLDRTEFVLATSRRDIRLAGLARSGDNWLLISK